MAWTFIKGRSVLELLISNAADAPRQPSRTTARTFHLSLFTSHPPPSLTLTHPLLRGTVLKLAGPSVHDSYRTPDPDLHLPLPFCDRDRRPLVL